MAATVLLLSSLSFSHVPTPLVSLCPNSSSPKSPHESPLRRVARPSPSHYQKQINACFFFSFFLAIVHNIRIGACKKGPHTLFSFAKSFTSFTRHLPYTRASATLTRNRKPG
ncbi:hypothetical protein EDB81DRAFT_200673 [Dactylonectria macrodidyma]|uniref:Uncharacterized protein n=1 Tax=Dactylonectria macrodidyma TaxID=307937 RepID=A0A9P9FS23_9HYPO|nr:hypothetical protein EDB81DRAFT_200673 [Dactylonectria macrodidyma]